MTNLEKVKKILCKRNPKDKSVIQNADEQFVCNRFLQNNDNRAKMAELLGLPSSKCSICAKQTEEDCPFWKSSRHFELLTSTRKLTQEIFG